MSGFLDKVKRLPAHIRRGMGTGGRKLSGLSSRRAWPSISRPSVRGCGVQRHR